MRISPEVTVLIYETVDVELVDVLVVVVVVAFIPIVLQVLVEKANCVTFEGLLVDNFCVDEFQNIAPPYVQVVVDVFIY